MTRGPCRRAAPDVDSGQHNGVCLNPLLLSGERALDQVRRFIAIGPRESGTSGAKKASEYIAARLKRLRSKVEVDEFEDDTPVGRKTFRNVTGHIGNTGRRVIVLGSHYDTKSGIGPRFHGANDSGSSTGLLLELASVLQAAHIPETKLMLAFFDGEECSCIYGKHDGLHGSKRFARKLVERGIAKKVGGVIVLDMIGNKNLNIRIPRNSTPSLCAAVFSAAQQEGASSSFSQSRSAMKDDHVPFLDAGMPAVDIIDFSYGSAAGLNDYWHTEDDTIDKLSAKSLETVGRVVVRLINLLAVDERFGVQ